MTLILWIVVISGATLVLLSILFGVERARGARIILPTARSWIDELLAAFFLRLSQLSISFGSGTIRVATLFLIHRGLSVVMRILKFFERCVASLQARNRRLARSVRAEQDKTHLDLIAEHKKTISLTEREKRHLKKQWLG